MNDWFTLLKVQVLDTVTDLNIDMEPMVEDNEDCIKWLKGLYDIFVKHKDADIGHPMARKQGPSDIYWNKDPTEEEACDIKEYLTSPKEAGFMDHNMTPFKGNWKTSPVNILASTPLHTGSNKVNIGCYFTDYIELGIGVFDTGAGDKYFNMDISAGWDKTFDSYEGLHEDVVIKLNNAFLEIFKYIGQKVQYDYWREELLWMYRGFLLEARKEAYDEADVGWDSDKAEKFTEARRRYLNDLLDGW